MRSYLTFVVVIASLSGCVNTRETLSRSRIPLTRMLAGQGISLRPRATRR